MSAEYASAVAAVKAMENSLLTASDIEQLIAARSKSEFNALLAAKKSEDETLSDVWETIRRQAPESRELPILLYANDFHNLKAVIKARLSNRDPSVYYIAPSNVELETLDKAITSKEYDILPEYLREAAEQAYDVATRTLDGQLSDSIIDSSALAAMQKDAKKTGVDFIYRYAVLTTVFSDIKTAFRCSRMGKNKDFLESAICGSPELDKASLIKNSLSGTEALFRYLDSTIYAEAASLLKSSPAQYEKMCDDAIMELAETARLKAFGVEPLAAYFIAKETEIKNVRILTVCRESGAEKSAIEERMRKLYV